MQRFLGTEIPIDNVISDLAYIAFVGMVLFLGAFAKQSKLIPAAIAVALLDSPANTLATSSYFFAAVHTLF